MAVSHVLLLRNRSAGTDLATCVRKEPSKSKSACLYIPPLAIKRRCITPSTAVPEPHLFLANLFEDTLKVKLALSHDSA